MTPSELARVQRRLGLTPDGVVSEDFGQKVRVFQKDRGLVVTGKIDDPTYAALGGLATEGLVPSWFGTVDEIETVQLRIGGHDRDSILRYQSAAGLPLTGLLDLATAVRIGD